MTLKLALKKSVASLCELTGIIDRLTKKSQPLILMYHCVFDGLSNSHFVQPGMYVYADTFSKHLKTLKSKFTILSLSELINRIKQGDDCIGCCSITFDDGWMDNYTVGFPLLKEYHIPATIFLTTGYIGTNRSFWPEEVIFYLFQIKDFSVHENIYLRELMSQMSHSPGTELNYDAAIELLKKWHPEKREELLEYLREKFPGVSPDRQMVNWDSVNEMLNSGLVEFGAHTANHIILDQVSLEDAEKEIIQSKNDIIRHLGVVPEFFAYPNGNCTPAIKRLLKHHDFKGAVTTRKGGVGQNVDFFEIPRIGMHEDVSNTVSMFLARLILKWF